MACLIITETGRVVKLSDSESEKLTLLLRHATAHRLIQTGKGGEPRREHISPYKNKILDTRQRICSLFKHPFFFS